MQALRLDGPPTIKMCERGYGMLVGWLGRNGQLNPLTHPCAEDASMRERLVNLRFRRDELAEQIVDLARRLATAEPVITPEKIDKLALLRRDKLHPARLICGKPTPGCC